MSDREPKRGRPPAEHPTEQISIRLPKLMLDHFRKGLGVSAEIQTRLARSLADELLKERLAGK